MATSSAASSGITATRQKKSSTPGPTPGCRPSFRDWNIEAALPAIRAPLLLLQGVEDEYGTAAQVEEIAKGVSGPVESHLLPGCGHVPHHQARERVLDLMTAFIRRQALGGGPS